MILKELRRLSRLSSGPWYWVFAVALVFIVWGGVSLAMWPSADKDGSYSSRPYGLTTQLENQALDLLFQLRNIRHPNAGARGLSEPITIIEIDEEAIRASGVRPQKWPRDWYARLVDRASEGGASVIGLDLFLTEKGGATAEDDSSDRQLVTSLSHAENVVLAMKLNAGGFESPLVPLKEFADAAWSVGFVDVPPDKDGFVRSSPLFQQSTGADTQFSFATRLAEGYLQAQDGKQHSLTNHKPDATPAPYRTLYLDSREIPLRTDLNLQLDFRNRPPAFRRISAADILFKNQPIPNDLFRDRIVLIGESYLGTQDTFLTPFFDQSELARILSWSQPVSPARTPGVELNATTTATILFGRMLWRPRYFIQIITLVLPLFLVGAAVFLMRPLWALLASILIAGGALAVCLLVFSSYGLILPLASSWLGAGVLTPLGVALRYGRERAIREEKEAERAQVMDIFSRFVSPAVAEAVWQGRDQFSLAGEKRTVTIVFTDIRDFTNLSERTPSESLVELLNDYFSRMQEIVFANGGHIDKFIGDGLMIIFGAPLDRGVKTEARAAVACGLAMLDEVARMNQDWRAMKREPIRIGIGIHTGEAVCGIVGAKSRLEYTVVGDTVNLASRLESQTKELGVSLLISEATANLMGEEYVTNLLGQTQVKGKTVSTTVFAVERRPEKIESHSSLGEGHEN